ncbi:hypothetical protein ACWG0P_03980 [Amedibacillus sp. YH-ame6]
MLLGTAIFNPVMILNAKNTRQMLGDGYIEELNTDDAKTKEWLIVDGNKEHTLYVDYEQHIMVIDGEKIQYEVTEIQQTRATINKASARNIKSTIPWKGSTILLAAAIGALISGGSAAGWAATIAGAVTADAPNIYVTFTQYDSIENYYSYYLGIYFKKSTNRNIKFYQNSTNAANLLLGPVNGGWFDPVRVY